jgi:hypothetical protein
MIRVLESGGDPASLQRVMSWLDRTVLLLGIIVLLLGFEVSHSIR